MASFSKGTSFQDGVTGDVTAAKLHALVDAATPVAGLVTDRTAKTSVVGADLVLLSDSADSNNLKKVSITNFANNLPTAVITNGTVTTLNSTTGTITGANITTGTIATATLTNANITAGTVATATLGTTTGTAATFTSSTIGTTTATAANITSGTVQTLTSSTATITGGTFSGLLNSSTGTFSGAINSTAGTIGTFNSTAGTIGRLTTTLAGDFTISQGTGTLGTSGVTVGTYGTSTAIPVISVDAKGRVTTLSTAALGSTGKVLQVIKANTTSVITCGTTIPWDDTIPQNTEGNEVLTATITPLSATSTIHIRFLCSGNVSSSSGANGLMAALFKDSDAGAISVFGVPVNGSSWQTTVSLIHYVSSATTTSRTYKIRVGMNTNTFYVNGNSSGVRVFGGASSAILELWEVEA